MDRHASENGNVNTSPILPASLTQVFRRVVIPKTAERAPLCARVAIPPTFDVGLPILQQGKTDGASMVEGGTTTCFSSDVANEG